MTKLVRKIIKKFLGGRTLCFVRREFVECPECASKPGSPTLCHECLERRELYSLVRQEMICPVCEGYPNINCKEHGR